MKYYAVLTGVFCLLAGMAACSWPVISPAVYLGFLFIILTGALSGGVSISVMMIGFSFWRVRVYKVNAGLDLHDRVFAREITAKVLMTPDQAHLWNEAYYRVVFVSRLMRGKFSFRTIGPYINAGVNSRPYWEHMAAALHQVGWLRKDPKKGYQLLKSHRQLYWAMLTGKVILPPHPDLPAPTVPLITQQESTVNTPNTDSTVTVSPGGVVYRGVGE